MKRYLIYGGRVAFLVVAMCTLSRDAGAIVSYTTNLKPAAPGYPSSLTLYAYCQDIYTGALYTGNPIMLSNTWTSNSNSHLHPNTPGHPQSTLSNSNGSTGSDGYFHFDVQASPIGQDEYITAHCTPPPGGATQDGHLSMTVGYPDVYYNDHPNMERVGGTVNHGSELYNRYMTTFAGYQIYDSVTGYLGLFTDTPDGMLAANDQALAYGGTFDLNANWVPPHEYHYRGTAADMRGNTLAHHIPVSRQDTFVSICQYYNSALAQIEYASASDNDTQVADGRRHVHCHWPLIQ